MTDRLANPGRITTPQIVTHTRYHAETDTVYVIKLRHDDTLGNGHNTFAITADAYERRGSARDGTVTYDGHRYYWAGGGAMGDTIAELFPEFAPAAKFHLCSTNGPMHYLQNTIYLAGDRDCWGIRKGEERQIRNGKTGQLCWKIKNPPSHRLHYIDADEKPADLVLEYEPWMQIGEGKERELDAARRAACWREATDEDLTADGLKERLEARLPALMAEFRAVVESYGLTYEATA